MQYTLEIKDGNSRKDKEMVRVSPYKHLEITKKIFPLHLFGSIFYSKKRKLIYALLKVQLQLFPTFTIEFAFIEEHLSKKEFPILLFRNIVKQKELVLTHYTHVNQYTLNH
jgi:hypothetical protein